MLVVLNIHWPDAHTLPNQGRAPREAGGGLDEGRSAKIFFCATSGAITLRHLQFVIAGTGHSILTDR